MVDTQEHNQALHLDPNTPVWLFGYGSLVYKVDFPILQQRPAYIKDWVRRFWQGSHDHRGTPEHPGRVATLIPQEQGHCDGMAYQVTPEVFAHLDHREKNGYLRLETTFYFEDDTQVQGLVYIALEDNGAYLGPASEQAIAQHIAGSTGPSGPNDEYLLKLAQALRKLGKQDQHVFAIEQELLVLQTAQ